MSEFHVETIRVGPIVKHPNADNLSITRVRDYPVILRTGEFLEGDLAVYVPVDAVVPAGDPRWAFLGEHRRIVAKRLRGIFSMGLLTAAPPGVSEPGVDVGALLGVAKYEPAEPPAEGEDEADPGFFPAYTDVEAIRRFPDVLREGEEVVLTEKVHGANARYLFHEGRLFAGSHTRVKRRDPKNLWWKPALALDLERRLAPFPGIAVYGEVFGKVQDLRYGMQGDAVSLVLFDAQDIRTREYLDYDAFVALAGSLDLPAVPVLHRGPWRDDLRGLAEGKTVIGGGAHCREGFVARPARERFDARVGRVILKLHGEDYLLRKSR
jgi:RNA ligase (TIGR02306 family)